MRRNVFLRMRKPKSYNRVGELKNQTMFKVEVSCKVVNGQHASYKKIEAEVSDDMWVRSNVMSSKDDEVLSAWAKHYFPDADKVEVSGMRKL